MHKKEDLCIKYIRRNAKCTEFKIVDLAENGASQITHQDWNIIKPVKTTTGSFSPVEVVGVLE